MAILTNGGGFGVLATDALVALGGRLAPLAPETMARLDNVLPADCPTAIPSMCSVMRARNVTVRRSRRCSPTAASAA